MDLKKTSTAYARMAGSAILRARPKSDFGENATYNDSSLKQRMKIWLLYEWFWQ